MSAAANPLAKDSYPQDAKKECCDNCRFLDGAICRRNPPVGTVWSKIDDPYRGWCGWWENGSIAESRMLQPPTKRVSGTGGVG